MDSLKLRFAIEINDHSSESFNDHWPIPFMKKMFYSPFFLRLTENLCFSCFAFSFERELQRKCVLFLFMREKIGGNICLFSGHLKGFLHRT